MRKRQPAEEQPSLFEVLEPQRAPRQKDRGTTTRPAPAPKRAWRMPELQGHTVAEIRLRWPRRLAPAQVARVEVELSALPKQLTKLGFGTVVIERAFVRRRRS
jgi:hypothetical protein